jgi:hypothetical protein
LLLLQTQIFNFKSPFNLIILCIFHENQLNYAHIKVYNFQNKFHLTILIWLYIQSFGE